MSDPLNLSLWYPTFESADAASRLLAVLREFPFSSQVPGITYTAVHPASWSEATILERRHRPGIGPDEAAILVGELFHDDYAYVYEAFWDLWVAQPDHEWSLTPTLVKVIAHGEKFEDGLYKEAGHIRIDIGPDSPFLPAASDATETAHKYTRDNITKLVDFTQRAERGSRASGRLLWSESEENLAQKLVASLQPLQ